MKAFLRKCRGRSSDFQGWELVIMRAAFSWLLWRMLPTDIPYSHQPVPNGMGRLFDLSFLAHAGLFATLRGVFLGALLLFTAGGIPFISLGYAALLLTMVGALENSQGAIGHHLQLVCMVALSQWVVYLGYLKRAPVVWIPPAHDSHQRAANWAILVIAASYVTSACVKLIASGGLWVVQLPDISLQLIKTHANVYYDTLNPQSGWIATQLPHFIATHPHLTRLFFAPGLLLELFAFLALVSRRWALFFGLGLLTMHLLVRCVMNLSFGAHEWLLVIYLVNVPYLAWLGLKRMVATKAPSATGSNLR
jgi:hypothetical protein